MAQTPYRDAFREGDNFTYTTAVPTIFLLDGTCSIP